MSKDRYQAHVRLPAEWEPQDGVQLTWPHAATGFGPWLDDVVPVFDAMARAIAAREVVLIACHDAAVEADVRARLAGLPAGRVRTRVTGSNDVWSRDHGPITVERDGAPVALDFRFTGWGGKFAAALDDVIPVALAPEFLGPVETIGLVLEGGGIESDGAGTLLTTTSVLLNPNRNPELDRAGIEAALSAHLGVTRVLWLEQGHLEGDDTDGHVDTLARLCPNDTIAYVRCDEPNDTHFASLAAMATELRQLRTRDGRPYRLVPLPWPRAIVGEDGRLPATYANFLIINGAVLVPTHDEPADAVALEAVASCFPGREIIGIDARPLLNQFGSLHCASMQLPRGSLRAGEGT